MDELNKAIEKAVKFISENDKPDSEEYMRAIRNLKELLDLKEKMEPKPQEIKIPEIRKRLTPEIVTILGILIPAMTSILGIVLIIKHEELNVITSKAMGFIMRSRI